MSPPDPLIGQTLAARYRIRRSLGSGRAGRVYAALDPVEKRKVAIKVLHPPLCAVEEQVLRFRREFEATSRIDDPNTVRMYSFEQDGAHRFLVMELLEGRRLDEVLENKRSLSVRRTVRIAAQVARALAAAHAAGVIHRDLGPGNVMLLKPKRSGDHEQVKVLDFGLARLQGNNEDLTAFGVRLGGEHYMSPEYITSSQIDARSDLYALGCLLYVMLTGRPPFIGPSMKVLDGHANRPPQAPSAEVPNLPEWLEELVLDLLAKAPADRPQTAGEVVSQLEAGLASSEIDEEPTQSPSSERPAPPLVSTGMAHGHMPDAPRTHAPSPWVAFAARVGLVLLLLTMSTVVAACVTWIALQP